MLDPCLWGAGAYPANFRKLFVLRKELEEQGASAGVATFRSVDVRGFH